MASFTIPYNRVSYGGRQEYFNAGDWDAYWGATITGDYGSGPYKLTITRVSVTARWKHHVSGATGSVTGGLGSGTLSVRSHKGSSSSIYSSVSIPISLSGGPTSGLRSGQYCTLTGSKTGSYNLKLSPDGGRLRAFLYVGGIDYGMIYSSAYYPSDYAPVNPDINISVNSNNVNNLTITLNNYILDDLSSYNYTFRVYDNAARTNQVWSKTGTNINDFPFSWNGAVPGTTYYWSLDLNGVNNRTGETLYMSTKTGTVSSQTPWVNQETFTYTASPLYNGHWTPRTKVNYTISESASNDSADGLSFSHYEIQTALNGLNSNTKSHNVTGRTGTISLVDTGKFVRAVKPRDLAYIKVRVVCKDNAGREYYSGWFGITTAQYIYNKFHVYLSNSAVNNGLRINSKVMFTNKNVENYWNIGEVK